MSESDPSDRLRSVSWTSDKFPPPGLGLARVSHQVNYLKYHIMMSLPFSVIWSNCFDRTSCLHQFLLGSETLFLEWFLFLRWLYMLLYIYILYCNRYWTALNQAVLKFCTAIFIAPSPQHCDTSMPPPPIHSPASSSQPQAAPQSPLSCCTKDRPLTFDSARMNARRKERWVICKNCGSMVAVVRTMLLNAHGGLGWLLNKLG